MRPITFLVAVLAVAPLSSVSAQERPPPVKVGDRVRVTHTCTADTSGRSSCQVDQGALESLGADSVVLWVNDRERQVLSQQFIARFEVRRGPRLKLAIITAGIGGVVGVVACGFKAVLDCFGLGSLSGGVVGIIIAGGKNSLKGAGMGFLIGAGAGAGLGALAGANSCLYEGNPCPAELAVAGAIIIGGGAAVLGATIGALAGHHWNEIPLDRIRVRVVPQRDGRFRLGLSVAF